MNKTRMIQVPHTFTNGYLLNTSSNMELLTHWDNNSSEVINYSAIMTDGVGASPRLTLTPELILDKMNLTAFQILTPSLILVILLLIIGLPGNLLAFVVYLTKMKRNTASYFIMALTFSDLVNCVFSLPVEIAIIANFWTFDFPLLCKLSRFITAWMNNTTSFVLVAIAVERFRSICTPLKPKFTAKLSKIICLSVYTLAALSAVPMIWGYGTCTYEVKLGNVTVYGKTCLIDDGVKHTAYPDGLLIYFFTGHLVVFLILAVLYVCIARKLLNGNQNATHDKPRSSEQLLARKPSSFSVVSYSVKSNGLVSPSNEKEAGFNEFSTFRSSVSSISTFHNYVTRRHGGQRFRTRRLTCMLFLMTSVFEISFIPYLTIVSIRNRDPSLYDSLNITGKMAYQFFLRFYLINMSLNPIIYCFYNQNFRHGVKLLFGSNKHCLWKKSK